MNIYKKSRNSLMIKTLKKQYMMHIFVLAGIMFLFVFSMIPMLGVLVAFKEYDIRDGFRGIFTGDFVGLKYFYQFFNDRKFGNLFRNTLIISSCKLIFSFPLPILFAIMLSEMKGRYFKRFVQTVSYLPHFISWVIVSGMLFSFFSTSSGMVNEILLKGGIIDQPWPVLMEPKYYYGLAVISDIWKELGWNAIIYLAAIAGIDPGLYESASIDGAGRIKKIWHITLPSIKGAISILLILAIGNLLSSANFEQALLLGNAMNISKSEIIEVFVYRKGLSMGRYSFAAAAGLFQSGISLVLVIFANKISNRISGASLF